MKRKISVILVLAMVFSMIMNLDIHAEEVVLSGKCGDNVRYELTSDGVLTLYGAGATDEFSTYSPATTNYGAPWTHRYRDSIVEIVVQRGVTSLGLNTFQMLYACKKVTLPKGLVSIGTRAFIKCSGIEEIVIPDTVTSISACAFYDTTNLKHITLSSSITSISPECFENSGLEEIYIPDGVTSISSEAFKNCKNLKYVRLPASIKSIYKDAFSNCFIETLEYAGTDEQWDSITFSSGNGLIIDKHIPNFVTENSIEYGSYNNKQCYINKAAGISGNVEIPSEIDFNITPLVVSGIGDAVFKNNTNIIGISLPQSITTIEKEAFSGCTSLTSLNLNPNLNYIGSEAFKNCSGLELTVPQGLSEICDGVFYGCTSMRTAEIPDGVASIGKSAFEGCTGITTVTVPESLETIGESAFSGCDSFKEIRLYGNLTEIGENAFFDCASLEKAIYFGTEEQWQSVAVSSGNDTLLSALVIHPDHVYDDDFDLECNVCGHVRDRIMYNVVFKDYDGSVISDQYCKIGQDIQIPDNPIRNSDNTYSYTFTGWDKTVSAVCEGDAEYTAVYNRRYINYTVEFRNWDGSVISSGTYHYGDAVDVPQTAERPATVVYTYTFRGWDREVSEICRGNATYNAEYREDYINYTVKFKNNDGSVLSSRSYHYGDTVTIPADPSRSSDNTYSYTFTGWDKPVSTVCHGDAEYTALYDSVYIEYTVTFKDYDGTVLSTGTYRYGETVSVPNPSRKSDNTYNYTFKGWNKKLSETCTGNAEYTATYTSAYINYTVRFLNDDNSVISEKTYHYNDKVTAPSSPSRSDKTYKYTFKSWDKPVEGTCHGNAEYKAIYDKSYINYTVKFVDYDGKVLGSGTYHYGNKIDVPKDPMRKSDATYIYSFKGWDKTVSKTCAGNAEYKALYNSIYIDYTVKFTDYDGTLISSVKYHYGDKIKEPSDPARKSDTTYVYSFKGWDKTVAKTCSGDAEYKALYNSIYREYTVKFSDYDGSLISSEKYHYDDEIKIPNDPERKEDNKYTYTFTGWDKKITACKGDAEYKAVYESTVKEILGDVNTDANIDNKDVVSLFRFVSGGNVEVNEKVCDVNSDKAIDNKDVVMLFRYVSENWPHFHIYSSWTVLKEATCTEDGKRQRVCSYGETDTQTIPAKGHVFGEDIILKEATCTSEGELEHTCTVCGITEKQKITSGGHKFSAWKTVKEATCAEEGKQERTCSICGKTETQSIPAKEHTFGKWTTTKAATCTQAGSQQRTCSVCGKKETKSIAAKGHVMGKATRENEVTATCGGTGSYDLVTRCTVCNEVVNKETVRYNSTYSKHTDTPTCQHCGANVRALLISAIKSKINSSYKETIIVSSVDDYIVGLALLENQPVVALITPQGISTYLYLDDTETIKYIIRETNSSNNWYISGNSMKKSSFTKYTSTMPYDDTNIPAYLTEGANLIQTMRNTSAIAIDYILPRLNSYLTTYGYSYSISALGFTGYSSY